MAGPRNLFASIYATDAYQKMYGRLATPIIQGPMVGATGSDFVSIWVRTDVERSLILQVSKDPEFASVAKEEAGRSTSADDYTSVIRIAGLEPSTTYFYRFITDDATVKSLALQTFTTFPAKDDKARFSIAFGGGAGYTPEHERMWDTLHSHKPAAMLLLGDNVYIDWPEIPETQRYCYYRRQSRPEFRAFVAKTPTFAIYDDHDFGKDDCWGGPDPDLPAWKRPALKVFSENWANPSYGGGKENPGCWFSTSINDVDFFFMDCRYYRDDKRVVKPGKTMLGAYQKAELKKALLASTATFKVICSTVPMGYKTKDKRDTCDTWDGYDEERREIFKFLDDNSIEGVFILAADRHRHDARVIEREKGYPLYEFMSSRLTNQITHGRSGLGTLFMYNEKCGFGKITFDFSKDDPTVTYDVVTIDNETVHSFTLKRSQLH
jgi:alkaline phosphatase D